MTFIYVLKCPFTGQPRYVGKSQNPKSRLAAHISKAKCGETRHHCAHWIRQLLKLGSRPVLEIVYCVPEDEDWQIHEKRLIAQYRSAGFDLTNLTGGGDGWYEPSPELLARRGRSISRYWMKPENNARLRRSMQEAQSRPEVRAAHSLGQQMAWQDPAKRLRFLAGMRTEEAKAKRSNASRTRYLNPEFLRLDSERKKRLFQDPARRAQIAQAGAKRWSMYRERTEGLRREREIVKKQNRERFLIEQAARLKARWQDEEHRAKMQNARWTPEKRAEQAQRIEARRDRMLAARTPDVRARQAETLRATWARRKAQQA